MSSLRQKKEIAPRGLLTTEQAANRIGCQPRLYLRVAKRLTIAPDKIHRGAYGTAYLWRIETVDRIAITSEFLRAHSHAEQRAQSAKHALETKRNKITAQVDALQQPDLPPLSQEELTEQAITHYNERQLSRTWGHGNDLRLALPTDSPAFLRRISANYARHMLTEYEKHLWVVKGRVGANEARAAIRSKVMVAIAAAFPWLAHECEVIAAEEVSAGTKAIREG